MPSLPEYVQGAWERVRSDVLLLALPVVGTVLQFENALRVLRAGPGGGVTFAFPTGFATLWSFVNVPTPDGVFVRPVAFVVGIVVHAALTAVYVPRVVERVRPGRGEVRVGAALSRYFAPVFGIALALAAVGLVLVASALALGPLVLLAFPVVLAVGYALYAAPFLVVVEDRGAVDAIDRSVDLATDGGAYASYGGQYLLVVALVSLPASTVVRLGLPALALAAVLAAPLATALTAATAAFVTDLVDGRLDDGRAPASDDDHGPTSDDGHASTSDDDHGPTSDEDSSSPLGDARADDGSRETEPSGNHWARETKQKDRDDHATDADR
ncbi:hypothetical protein [Halorubellus salinus]|uniref:hypothetical protein n=1 Tax=Halorubellus salinus TaxID=755309 RepID=UPI001D0710D5|nr:hypothetical protein [Halorubellus salinus]